ncbi:SIS domain-containing protein [Pelagibacteraceae bacterium]|nr:SIS domain-containing protein [Pelagibacteraceae bacterium]
MPDKSIAKKYFKILNSKIIPDEKVFGNMIKIKDLIVKVKKNKSRVLIFGNGGSAAIASHVSVDLTKNVKVKAMNFNEADLITCFSNDYGYEKWIEKTIEFYADKKDILILISSSGKSKNMVNACKAAKRKKVSKIITLTGNKKNNPLSKLGDINLWVDSNIYNHIENIHQIWLLAICDLIKLNKVK